MSNRTWRDVLIFVAVVLFLLVISASLIFGQDTLDTGGWRAANCQTSEWEFSPAAPHHAAIVRVQAGHNGGSGVYVAMDGHSGILTAAHILSSNRTATVVWGDGTQSQGECRIDKYGNDVGMVLASNPEITPLALADADPAPGSRVEFATYGGPSNRLRTFWAMFEGKRQLVNGVDALYSASVSPGDSGGAVLNSGHRVVGIVEGGRSESINGKGWPVYRGSVSVCRGPIHAFVERVFGSRNSGACPPQGCPPRRGPVLEWERGGRIEFYPRRQPQPEQSPPPVLPGPGPAPEEQPEAPLVPIKPEVPTPDARFDAINARLDELAKAIAAIPAGPRGPQGLVGLPGSPGLPGTAPLFDPADLTDAQVAALAERLPPIYLRARDPDTGVLTDEIVVPLGHGGIIVLKKGNSVSVSGGSVNAPR